VKVILVTDVPKLGKRGQVIAVADGYGRNYLLPKGLGIEATPANLRRFEGQKDAKKRRSERETSEAETLAGRLDGFSLTVKAKAGEEGRLFGSVTNKDIASGIKDILGLDIDKRRIEIEEPLKTLGTYRVAVRLSQTISREITVAVEALE